MTSDDDTSHKDHYPQIKYRNKWYVMAPELVNQQLSSKTEQSRCTGCAFYDSRTVRDSHCRLQEHDNDAKLEARAGSCDTEDDEGRFPHIYVRTAHWEQYIAQRVSIRLDS